MFQIVEFCNLCGRAAAAEVVQAGGELHRVEQRGAAARQAGRGHHHQASRGQYQFCMLYLYEKLL